eukprot:scaffold964_cov170-Amphora_coffeaeformis.AAC.8
MSKQGKRNSFEVSITNSAPTPTDNSDNCKSGSEEGGNEEATNEICSTDILVGRGYQYENHPGNVMFYHEIDASMEEYHGVTTKKKKSLIVNRIYNAMTFNGRFIQRVSSAGHYKVVEEKVAKQKISHALRYRRQLTVSETDTRAPNNTQSELQQEETEQATTTISAEKRAFQRNKTKDEQAKNKKAKVKDDRDYLQHQSSGAQHTRTPVIRSDSDDLNWDAMSWPELQHALGHPEEYIQPGGNAINATTSQQSSENSTSSTDRTTTEAAYVSESASSKQQQSRCSSVTGSQQGQGQSSSSFWYNEVSARSIPEQGSMALSINYPLPTYPTQEQEPMNHRMIPSSSHQHHRSSPQYARMTGGGPQQQQQEQSNNMPFYNQDTNTTQSEQQQQQHPMVSAVPPPPRQQHRQQQYHMVSSVPVNQPYPFGSLGIGLDELSPLESDGGAPSGAPENETPDDSEETTPENTEDQDSPNDSSEDQEESLGDTDSPPGNFRW